MGRPRKDTGDPAKAVIYLIELTDGTQRFVKAVNKQRAVAFVLQNMLASAEAASNVPERTIAAAAAGVKVEEAEADGEEGDEDGLDPASEEDLQEKPDMSQGHLRVA